MNAKKLTFLNKNHFQRVKPEQYSEAWLDADGQIIGGILEDDSFAAREGIDSWSSEVEEMHEEPTKTGWIDVYERERVLKTFSKVLSREDGLVIEFGSSAGYMIEELSDQYPKNMFVATDLMADGLRQSYKRNQGIMHIRCDFTDAPFHDGVADLIFSLNVLEHIADDMTTILECHRVLKPGGYCLFVVPRGERLYDYFDEMLFHKRRYARGELRSKCEKAGFTVIDNFHFAWLCYPAFWVKKRLNQLVGKSLSQEEKTRRVQADINQAMASPLAIGLMRIEHRLSKIISPAFGVREFILLRKSKETK